VYLVALSRTRDLDRRNAELHCACSLRGVQCIFTFIDIVIIVAYLLSTVLDRLLGFAPRFAEHAELLSGRQHDALVHAGHLERIGHVRHQRHHAAGLWMFVYG
jgi:hypothetical protein